MTVRASSALTIHIWNIALLIKARASKEGGYMYSQATVLYFHNQNNLAITSTMYAPFR